MENKHKETGKFISGVGIINPELVTVGNDYSLSVAIALNDLTVELHGRLVEEIDKRIATYEKEYREHWKGESVITVLSLDISVDDLLPPHYGVCVRVEALENDEQSIDFIMNIDELNRNDLDYLLTLAIDAMKAEILKRSNI